MRNLCTGDRSHILQALWLEKLQAQVTSVPAPVKQKSLDKQANHADHTNLSANGLDWLCYLAGNF